jgi:hypothetical protein
MAFVADLARRFRPEIERAMERRASAARNGPRASRSTSSRDRGDSRR